MLSRYITSLVLAATGALLMVAPTLAGGWATIALDSSAVTPTAGEPQRIGFTVLQHGHNPVNEIHGQQITPHLTATNQDTGERVRVGARQEGAVGHFVAAVTFPSAGTWEWEITPDPFPLVTDAAVITGQGHEAGAHEESMRAASEWKPVLSFAPLTVSPAETELLGITLSDTAITGSLAALVLLALTGVVVVRRRGLWTFSRPRGTSQA